MDLSLKDVAKILKVSEDTLTHWVSEEGLPAFVINGRYRFNRVDILEWASRRNLPTAALYESGPEALSLAALLEGNIHYGVPGTDIASAMAAVADRLPLSAADRALAARILSDREGIGSTGVGGGIALPHARSPLVFATERPLAALCFMAVPIPFNAPDGKPVEIILALVTPTVRGHLQLLARAASALQDARLLELMRARRPAPELLARLKELA